MTFTVLVKAILLLLSPGEVANADWFGYIIGIGSAAMKMLDRTIIILTIIALLPNSRKLCVLAVVSFIFFSDVNNLDDDDIILRKGVQRIR